MPGFARRHDWASHRASGWAIMHARCRPSRCSRCRAARGQFSPGDRDRALSSSATDRERSVRAARDRPAARRAGDERCEQPAARLRRGKDAPRCAQGRSAARSARRSAGTGFRQGPASASLCSNPTFPLRSGARPSLATTGSRPRSSGVGRAPSVAFAVDEPARLPLPRPDGAGLPDDARSGLTRVADRAVASAPLRTRPLDHARGPRYRGPRHLPGPHTHRQAAPNLSLLMSRQTPFRHGTEQSRPTRPLR
jgi:hypothetical protein